MAAAEDTSPSTWKARATDMQQNFFKCFGKYDWDEYLPSEREFLKKKVGFALFGPPTELPFTVAERISSAIVDGDKKTFLYFLEEDDWSTLRSSAREFAEILINSTLFRSRLCIANYENLKEYHVINMVSSYLMDGDKDKFLNYFDNDTWESYLKSLNNFVEQQVNDFLFEPAIKRSGYTTKQNEIISRVASTIKSGDMPRFCYYLPEIEWYSIQNTVCEVLEKEVGKSLYGSSTFSYNKKQKKEIDTVCTALLREDYSTLLQLVPEAKWGTLYVLANELLTTNIGNTLFGCPGQVPPKKKENQTGYNSKQFENIEKICSVIMKEDKHKKRGDTGTWMSIVFVCLEICREDISEVFPVAIFRVPNSSNGSSFIDSSGRVYKHWQDFLENNELPECRYCYPRNGVYKANGEDSVVLDFGNTPASKMSRKILKAMDVTSAGVGLGTAVVTIAAGFVPVAGPLLAASVVGGASAGVYSIFRSSGSLVDRAQHNQSIGLEDAEARSCWISLVGSAIGTAAVGATTVVTRMTQAGQVVGRAGRITTTILNFSSVVVNGIGVVHGAFALHNKYQEGELTPLDVFQFSASVFFFTHSAMNIKTADTIIKETQTEVIQKYEDSLRSNRHRKMFRKVARNTQKDMDVVEGRAAVIRSIRKIDNKDDYFAGLVRSDKDFRKTKSTVKFTETGHVNINDGLTIDPMDFAQLNRQHRQEVLMATQDLASGKISHSDFIASTDTIFRDYNTPLTVTQRKTYISNINSLMNDEFSDVSSEGKTVLHMVYLYEMANIYRILTNVNEKLHFRIIRATIRVCEFMGWTDQYTFVKVLVFISRTMMNTAYGMEQKYQEDLWKAREGANFNQEDFDTKYENSGRRFEHFCAVVLEQFISDPMILDALITAFKLNKDFDYTPPTNKKESPETVETSPDQKASGFNNATFSVDSNLQCIPEELHENSGIISSEQNNCGQTREASLDNGATQHVIANETATPLCYSEEQPLTKSRSFWLNDEFLLLSQDEIFDIVLEVTGQMVDHTNCFVVYEGVDVNVTVVSPDGSIKYVVMKSNVENDTVIAYANHIH